jgi:hypothetical protein
MERPTDVLIGGGGWDLLNQIFSGRKGKTCSIITKQYHLREMSLEELWKLHEKIAGELTHKMTVEKAKLEERELPNIS